MEEFSRIDKNLKTLADITRYNSKKGNGHLKIYLNVFVLHVVKYVY